MSLLADIFHTGYHGTELANVKPGESVEVFGVLGISGLYIFLNPGGVDENVKESALSINFGELFEKGFRLGTGQCNVKS